MMLPLLCVPLLLMFCSSGILCEKASLVNTDGLIVTTGGDVHAVTSYWKLVVTLDKPPPPIDVLEYAQHLLTAIEKLDYTGVFVASWLSRIHQVQYWLTGLSSSKDETITPSRGKRGLFDFVGHISRALFGTATDSEVSEVKQMIQRVGSATNGVTHVVQELVTVVNKTRESAIANRVRLNELALRQNHMSAFLQRLNNSSYWMSVQVERLKVKLEVDRILEDLEMMTDAYCDTHMIYHFQRGSLEWGKLSEDILSLEQLRQILHKGKGQNMMSIEPVEWYYRFCEVEPLWSSDKTLVYRVSIPFVDRKKYLKYSIESFPIPLNDSNMAKLQIHGSYGYNTVTGDMFTLEQCMGNSPMVCDASVVYNNQGMKCARGVISGDTGHRDTCPVDITKALKQTVVKNVGLNNYVVITWGELVTRHCEGMPESKIEMLMGVHHVSVNASCTLTGKSWKLVGIRTHLQVMNVSTWRLHVVETFHLEKMVSTGLAKFQAMNPLAMLPEIHSVPIERLRVGHLMPLQWVSGSGFGMLPWINLAGIMLIFSVLLFMTRRNVSATLQGCIVCKPLTKVLTSKSVTTGIDDLGAQRTEELITPPVQFDEYTVPLSKVNRQGEKQGMTLIKVIEKP